MERPPLHRRKASDGHFPSVLPSPLWTSEDIALLGSAPATRTQSRADKQAAKIADYLQLYGGALPQSRTMTGKSSAPTVKVEDLQAVFGRTTQMHTNSVQMLSPRLALNHKQPQTRSREVEKLKKEAEDISYTIHKAASDKLELMRDLATYEHLFSSQHDLPERLLTLRCHAAKLPSIFDSLNQTIDYEREAYKEVKEGLSVIGALSKETDLEDWETNTSLTSFDLRPLSDAFVNRELYRGAANISNIHCLVSVSGDGLFHNMKIVAQTLSGLLFRMIIHQDLLEQQNLTTPLQVRKAVKALILPHLYFQSFGNEMKLLFDPDCAVSFLTLIIEVKGYDEGLVTSKLTEAADEVCIDLSIFKEPILIARSDISPLESIFAESLKSLARETERHLLWRNDIIIWMQNPTPKLVFASREKHSRFLDNDYISDVFQILNFQVVSTERFQCDTFLVRVEVLMHKELMRLRLSTEDRTLELDSGSPELSLALGLQSISLLTSRVTLLKSLEFRAVVRRLFPIKL